MQEYSVVTSIQADPASVWQVLVDASGYSTWDSGIERITGRIAPGEKIKVYSAGRAFPARVTEFRPGERMRWTGGMPLGLFRGERTFTLDSQDATVTRFGMREEFSGPLLPLISRTMPDLGPAFERFAAGLKRRVEHT